MASSSNGVFSDPPGAWDGGGRAPPPVPTTAPYCRAVLKGRLMGALCCCCCCAGGGAEATRVGACAAPFSAPLPNCRNLLAKVSAGATLSARPAEGAMIELGTLEPFPFPHTAGRAAVPSAGVAALFSGKLSFAGLGPPPDAAFDPRPAPRVPGARPPPPRPFALDASRIGSGGSRICTNLH